MSTSIRSASFAAAARRAAFSRRQLCQGPAKYASGRLRARARRRDRFEEPAVVRDEDDGGVDRLQLALEPFEAGDVEVVRRLVEEQEVWVAAERACQRGARQLAAGERCRAAGRGRRREAEAAGDRVEPLAPGVAARVLEPRLRLAVACGASPARGHRRPSPARGGVALPRRRSGRRPRRGRTRAAWRRARAAGAGRAARSACPSGTRARRRGSRSPRRACRSSVVLPAPFGPESDERGRGARP